MKFKDVPIGAKFKEMDGLELIKTPEFLCHNSWCNCITTSCKYNEYNQEQYARKSIQDDEEVELITKCSNCKYYDQDHFGKDYGFYYCKKVKFNYPDGADVEMKEDQETFSCSNFEMKVNL